MKLDGIKDGARIAVAMSGGVDSSVVAALMVESGYEVVGITLQLYDHGQMALKKGACCAGQDIYDARNVADKLGFPHYVLDYESVFKQSVIDDFADSYLRGETPVPCIRCNQEVKFKDLLKTAQDLGAQALVTGHYVRRLHHPTHPQLIRAHDDTRDQSYFLFATTHEQLSYLRFPLGDIPKTETRAHALRLGLDVANKPDSQDICFVPQGNYVDVVSKIRPHAKTPGRIVHVEDGRVLGDHPGIIHYTIGQRKGLGVSANDPLYVVRLDAATHTVFVGPKEALAQTELHVKEINWMDDVKKNSKIFPCYVKFRSTHAPIEATVYPLPDARARIVFVTPEYGIAAGQACVFYENDILVGGGWVCAEK